MNYSYDPREVAAELDLPLEMIKESVIGFIEQANEYYDDLLTILETGDYNNIHILSEKLYGIAAGLAVKYALEAITIIKDSKDADVLEINIRRFYMAISRLESMV